jgi:superoxide reductase
MTTRFYKCPHCGNVIQKVVDSKVPVVCCGEPMKELIPNTVDASTEKHVPFITNLIECDCEGQCERIFKIQIGSTPHPMTSEHHIAFIYIETERGGICIDLTDKPEAEICLCMEKPTAVYEYCNLHGLWKLVL